MNDRNLEPAVVAFANICDLKIRQAIVAAALILLGICGISISFFLIDTSYDHSTYISPLVYLIGSFAIPYIAYLNLDKKIEKEIAEQENLFIEPLLSYKDGDVINCQPKPFTLMSTSRNLSTLRKKYHVFRFGSEYTTTLYPSDLLKCLCTPPPPEPESKPE
jgi:hypothetical protein